MPKYFADKVISFNENLKYSGKLPKGFHVLNPFIENPETIRVMKEFYHKFYDDNKKRKFLIGINPSRHGAGITGVPFTDTKRLDAVCGIKMHSAHTHEISSVFMYDMIAAYGGVKKFYRKFYINSPFPLAIVKDVKDGLKLNANYYDDNALFEDVKPFMIETLKLQMGFGLDTSEVYVLGKKNAVFINKLCKAEKLFTKLVVLEHPRFIQQYKSKEKELYIDKYLRSFEGE